VDASVILPRWVKLTALPQISLLNLMGHFEAGEREGKGRKGGKREKDTGEQPNILLVTA